MSSRKPRVLLVNEASFLASGYSTYGNEVMRRLHATGKYEMAELACYGSPEDLRRHDVPWTYFPNMPPQGHEEEWASYHSRDTNQWGEWAFNDVVIKFRPDIVWDIRDPWMMAFEETSPHRRHYCHAYMPTVDAEPQQEQWLSTYASADAVLTYTDWGQGVLSREGGGLVNLRGAAPPGADLDIFRPMHKDRLRKKFGFEQGVNIVGTVMRNNPRKLYPQLIRDFASFLERSDPDLARRTFLYLHVSYPDNAWDIPRLIKQSGISRKILVTYRCRACEVVFPSLFQDARGICVKCGRASATLPNVEHSVGRDTLAMIINLFDLYVQYAQCLKPGSMIYSAQGWKPVESIAVGDMVWTHQGRWRRVLRTFDHDRGDRPLDLSVCGDYEKLTITDEHPVYAIRSRDVDLLKNRSLRETIGHRIRNKQQVPPLMFVPAGTLSKGDMIGYRIDDSVVDIEQIDLSRYARPCDRVLDNVIEVKHGKSRDRYIAVDDLFCRWLGLYVANGNSGLPGGISITLHDEKWDASLLACDVMSRFQSLRPTPIPYDGRLAVDIRVYSTLHRRLFKDQCGKRLSKRLPEWCERLPITKQEEIIRGLCMGDGHYISTRNVTVYVTISPILARQIKILLRRCRIDFNAHLVTKQGKRHPQYRFEMPGDLASGKHLRRRSNSQHLYLENWHLMQVKGVEDSDYKGPVHNIEVEEDNSYMTEVGVVHNCEGFGLPMVEAAACGVPVMAVDYSAMSDVVRKVNGYPIAVSHYDVEPGSERLLARPDDNNFVRLLGWFFGLSDGRRREASFDARMGVERNYTWDKCASRWMDVFDSFPTRGPGETWDSPPRIHHGHIPLPPEFPSNEAFVDWAIVNVLGRAEMRGTYLALRMIRDLNWGWTYQSAGVSYASEESVLGQRRRSRPFGLNEAMSELTAMREFYNEWEEKRCHAKT